MSTSRFHAFWIWRKTNPFWEYPTLDWSLGFDSFIWLLMFPLLMYNNYLVLILLCWTYFIVVVDCYTVLHYNNAKQFNVIENWEINIFSNFSQLLHDIFFVQLCLLNKNSHQISKALHFQIHSFNSLLSSAEFESTRLSGESECHVDIYMAPLSSFIMNFSLHVAMNRIGESNH